ncbi:hypothetical protein LZY01_22840 [Levilactobacillus zymae]|uniref:Uncharacterized protein n=1 Tax=Levilactobacillus zymae TaxID=267363 RepID=A0ABQ0X1J4_9LACO|nr:hypothetical protein LZY01_22840 [Levilactobacillus zymae]
MGSGVKFVLAGVLCRPRQRSVFKTWAMGLKPCPPRSSPFLTGPEALNTQNWSFKTDPN